MDMASLLNNMAGTLYKEGRYKDGAMEKLQLSLSIREKLFGMDHQETVNARNSRYCSTARGNADEIILQF